MRNGGFIIWIFLILIISGGFLKAQESVFSGLRGDLKKADDFFEVKAYQNALNYYLLAVENKDGDEEVFLRIAECYYFLNNLSPAVTWYDRYFESKGDYNKEILLRYVNTLKANRQFSRATEILMDYQINYPEDIEVASEIWQLQNINYLYEDSVFYDIKAIPVNSANDDFGPVFHGDKLIFVSNRDEVQSVKRIDATTNKPFFDWYQSDIKMYIKGGDTLTEYSKAKIFSEEISSRYHKGCIFFNAGGDSMVFVRSSSKPADDGSHSLKFFFARMHNGRWQEYGDFPFNSDKYSVNHPFISGDGKTLYFSSDMPGGKGGTDIYMSKLIDGKWYSPVNLGNEINTSQNEGHPFIHKNIFYFSSDGHPGLGGLDIFKINRNDKLVEVINPGYPLNTSKDDFGLVLDSSGKKGYLVSNRDNGKGGDDIYEIYMNKPSYPLSFTGNIFFKDNSARSGVTLEILSGAKLELIDIFTDRVVEVSSTDEKGGFKISIPFESRFLLKVSKKGFGESLVSMDIPRNPKNYFHHDIVIVKDLGGDLYLED